MKSSRLPGGMSVSELDEKSERADQRGRRLRVGAVATVVVATVAVASSTAWRFTPPAMPTDLAEANQLVQSPRFERLSKERKQPYLDVIREQFGSLNPEERRALRGDPAARLARDQERDERVAAYAVMSFAERRVADAAAAAERASRPPRAQGEGGGERVGGDRGGGQRGPRGEGGAAETPAGAERGGGEGRRGDGAGGRERLSDRLANGNAQQAAMRGEMRASRPRGEGGGGPPR